MGQTGIGMLIRRFRGGRSRSVYAESIGVSTTAVFKYERGDFLPALPTVGRIASDAMLTETERRAFLDLLLDTAVTAAGAQ